MSSADSRRLLDEVITPTTADIATQYVMVGFRLREGINIKDYQARFHDDFCAHYLERMKPFLEKKYIIQTKTGYRLSRRGMLISNYILSEILEF